MLQSLKDLKEAEYRDGQMKAQPEHTPAPLPKYAKQHCKLCHERGHNRRNQTKCKVNVRRAAKQQEALLLKRLESESNAVPMDCEPAIIAKDTTATVAGPVPMECDSPGGASGVTMRKKRKRSKDTTTDEILRQPPVKRSRRNRRPNSKYT